MPDPAKPLAPTGFLTIRTVMQRTGAHRQTIHYYLRKRVLPTPVRTSRTTAVYPPSTVELIKLVKKCQERYRLKLDEIVALFQQAEYDPRAVGDLLARQEAAAQSGTRKSATTEELIAALDPRPERAWVEDVVRRGLLPFERSNGIELFPPAAVETAKVVWRGFRHGVPLDDFVRWSAEIEGRGKSEVEDFLRVLRDLPVRGEGYRKIAALFDVYERFGTQRRRLALGLGLLRADAMSRYVFVGQDMKYVFPSETLLSKMGIYKELDRLRLALDRRPDDLAALRNLCRAHSLRSDWAHLQQACVEILRRDPNDNAAIGDLVHALRYLGRTEDSITLVQRALERGSDPLLKMRLAQSLVVHARRMGDLDGLLESLVNFSRLADEALRESRESPALHRKIRLIVALDSMGFFDPLGVHGPALEELLDLHREFHNIREKNLPVLSRISLVRSRIFLTYALYLHRHKAGHRDAERYRRDLVKVDPHGVLAARFNRKGRS